MSEPKQRSELFEEREFEIENQSARNSRRRARELAFREFARRDRSSRREDYANNYPLERELIRELRCAGEYRTSAQLSAGLEYNRISETGLRRTHEQIISPAEVPRHLVEAAIEIDRFIMTSIRRNPSDIHLLEPRQFEECVAEILASFGWRIELSPKTRDGGYDIYALSRDRSGLEMPWLIECKKYRPDRPVGVEIVRSFWAVKTDLRVPNGLIATTSRFTSGAERFKRSRYDLAFRDFEAIVDWLNQYRVDTGGHLYIEDYRLRIGKLL